MPNYEGGYTSAINAAQRRRYEEAGIQDMLAAIAAQQWRQQQFEQTQAQQKMLDAAKVQAAREQSALQAPPPQQMAPGQPSVPMMQPPAGGIPPPQAMAPPPAMPPTQVPQGAPPMPAAGAVPAGPAPGGAAPPQGFAPIAGGTFAPPIGAAPPGGGGLSMPPMQPEGQPILPPKLQTMESALKIVDKLGVPDNVKGQLLDHLAEQMDKQNKAALQKYRDDAYVQEVSTRVAAEARKALAEQRKPGERAPVVLPPMPLPGGKEGQRMIVSFKTGGYDIQPYGAPAPLSATQAAAAGGEGKPPSGYRWSEQTPGQLEAIPGGPSDPAVVAAKKNAIQIVGGRESVFVNRVVQAMQQASKDIKNISKLPFAAQTTGWFGGRGQPQGIFNATKEVLAQKMTSADALNFNVMATGLQRALAQIETSGVAQGIQEFSKTIDVVAKEGDPQITKLHKMAQMRQIMDAATEAALANDRVPPGQKDLLKKTQEEIHQAIPFTHSDLIDLAARQETNPRATLRDVLPQLRTQGVPVVGEERKGYRFKGGDPAKQENWEKI